ncbi:hypothetical protein KC354_g107 [Hortaea werneckii]|nr:hypothetical protein KC354_g107 [Hortaea werneckii]
MSSRGSPHVLPFSFLATLTASPRLIPQEIRRHGRYRPLLRPRGPRDRLDRMYPLRCHVRQGQESPAHGP